MRPGYWRNLLNDCFMQRTSTDLGSSQGLPWLTEILNPLVAVLSPLVFSTSPHAQRISALWLELSSALTGSLYSLCCRVQRKPIWGALFLVRALPLPTAAADMGGGTAAVTAAMGCAQPSQCPQEGVCGGGWWVCRVGRSLQWWVMGL